MNFQLDASELTALGSGDQDRFQLSEFAVLVGMLSPESHRK